MRVLARLGPLASLLALPALLGLLGRAAAGQGVHPITGRHIAPVMGHSGADWLDRPEREEEEAPSKAVALLQLRPGDVVADVGAGSGYMTVRLARAVGPTGRVLAVDIQPEMIERLTDRVHREMLTNVTAVLGAADDPKLPAGSVDLELLVDVYHELAAPQRMLQHLRSALKPGGRLVLLEYRKEDPSIPIREEHKMSVADAKAEIEPEGFMLVEVKEDLPRQHILIFRGTVPRDR
jgi:ubiquinone/menaquinone biosynthesis C-methylase UbiE